MKKIFIMFVLSLMTVLFAGCADDKGEPNIIYEKDNNTDTGTDIPEIPENITYSFLVNSVSHIDKTDNTSEWRFLPLNETNPLDAVIADMLGRPDNESDKIMCFGFNRHLEGDHYACYSPPCYYDNTVISAYFCEYENCSRCWTDYNSLYTINIDNNISPYIYDYKILFSYIKEQILNNPYQNRYQETDWITVKTSE